MDWSGTLKIARNQNNKRVSSLKDKRSSVSVSNGDISLSKLPRLPSINQGNDYNTRLSNLQKAISVNNSQISLDQSKLSGKSKPRTILDLKGGEGHPIYTNRIKLSTRKLNAYSNSKHNTSKI